MNKRKTVFFYVAIVYIATAFAPLLFAAGEDRYYGDQWALLDLKQVMTAAATITTATHRNCDEVVIDGKLRQAYHPDGTAESQYENFTKILTDKGKLNNHIFNCRFSLPYIEVKVVCLDVIKSNGKIIPVNIVTNSRENIDSRQMQSNIYDPNHRVLRVNIPDLEVGDIVHSVIHYTTIRPYIPGEFADDYLLEGTALIRHFSLEIQAPKERPLKHIVLKNEVPKTITYLTSAGQAGSTIYHWEITNVPRMVDEPAMPSYNEVLQHLRVSTIPDWQTISRWAWEINQPHLKAITPEMQTTVNQLTSGAMTEMEKIKALFYYVSKQIRYMGVTPEQDRPGFEPHDVKLTFTKKYGVCRDKAALLVAMLQMAGLEAYPVLTNVGAKVNPEVPALAFNHAIVAVILKNGEELLLDPTNENTLELLPIYENNQNYLICRPSGAELKTIPITPADANMLKIKTTGIMTGSGGLRVKSELSFDGINDNHFRNMFARKNPDELRVYFEQNLRGIIPGAHLTQVRLTPANMLDMSAPLRAEIIFNIDSVAVLGNEKAVIDVPWTGTRFGIVNSILENTSLAQRKFPLKTGVTCGIREEISIKLPDNFTNPLSIPSFIPVVNPYLSYNRYCVLREQTLECFQEFKLNVVEFTPSEYLNLKKLLQEQAYAERKKPIFTAVQPSTKAKTDATGSPKRKTPKSANVKILTDQRTLVVKNVDAAILKVSYKKQILSYSGKKREAEVKIPYNPATQEVKLITATVTSETGEIQQVEPGEIHRMDADWNASAKRYNGGKIFVVNLPGVEIGSVINVEYEISMRGRQYISGFEPFQSSEELSQKSLRIIAPNDIKISHWLSGPVGAVKRELHSAGANQEILWQTGSVAPLPAETNLPPDWTFKRGVAYFIGNPKIYLKMAGQTMIERAMHSQKSQKTALELAKHTRTKLEAVKVIRDYIVKSVRLSGPAFTDLPLNQLSDADTTLTDGYGHQADRAILFYAMLKAIGLKPEFVLASNLPPVAEISKIVRSFPLPDHFYVPLVRVVIKNETYYLNDTDQYAWLGTTPHTGKMVIILPSLAYETIQPAQNGHEEDVTTYSIALQDNGRAKIKVKKQYYGMAFAEKNRLITAQKGKNNRLAQGYQYYQKAVSAISQGALPAGDLVYNFKTHPGTEEFTVDIDNFGVIDGSYFYFNLPFIPKLLATAMDERTLPFYIGKANKQTIRVAIDLPESYRHVDIIPQNQNFTAPAGAGIVKITTEHTGNQLLITYQLQSQPAMLTPADYSVLQAFETFLESQACRMILLESGK
ncbi:MAG TPA: DUF3857 domain-containing protein [Bacillota bacterium]|nr:DUF3857 domain-containing protein [Bacillota bacterium]